MTDSFLSSRDVLRLIDDPSADARIATMTNLLRDLEHGELSAAERLLALEVMRCFAEDAQIVVREAVAWQIRNSPALTEELAERLVRDVARVAFPLLRDAPSLDDALLLAVLAEGDAGKQLAIAARSGLSAPVAGAVAAAGNIVVVTTLLRNHAAPLDEAALNRALDRFGGIRMVGEAASARPGLPLAVVERLVALVSDSVRGHLVQTYGLAPTLVDQLVARGRESATLRLLRPTLRGATDAETLAQWLNASGRLSSALMFRLLCAGDLDLFAAALGAKAGVPAANARQLAWDDGPLGLAAVLKRAGVAPVLVPAFQTAIDVAKRLAYDGAEAGRDDFQAEVMGDLFATLAPTSDWAVDELLLQLFDGLSEAVIDNALDRAGLPFAPLFEPPLGPSFGPVSMGTWQG